MLQKRAAQELLALYTQTVCSNHSQPLPRTPTRGPAPALGPISTTYHHPQDNFMLVLDIKTKGFNEVWNKTIKRAMYTLWFLLGSYIGHFMIFCWANVLVFAMNLRKTQSDNTFQSTLNDFFLGECVGFYHGLEKNHKVAMSTLWCFFAECVGFYHGLEKNHKVAMSTLWCFFAECVGFYYGLEKNRKVELRSKETILCFFFQRTPLYDFSLIHGKNQHIRPNKS